MNVGDFFVYKDYAFDLHCICLSIEKDTSNDKYYTVVAYCNNDEYTLYTDLSDRYVIIGSKYDSAV